MKQSFVYLSILSVLLVGCEYREDKQKQQELNSEVSQAQMEMDKEITAALKKVLSENPNVSFQGKGIKIITIRGVVTLKGGVNNHDEKKLIEKLAQGITNVKLVDNQLEVVVPPAKK